MNLGWKAGGGEELTRDSNGGAEDFLGGGDGMAAREVLKYTEVKRIDVVDLDPEITALFSDHPQLSALNDSALSDPRVHVTNDDALAFLESVWDLRDDLSTSNNPADHALLRGMPFLQWSFVCDVLELLHLAGWKLEGPWAEKALAIVDDG